MQLLTIAYARSILKFDGANSNEIDPETSIRLSPPCLTKLKNKNKNYGATMRLGAYPAVLEKSIAAESYGTLKISERHRHRYEVNPKYIPELEKAGLVFSGKSQTEF